ncbi:unnamed protein product, partial [Mesorhabditis belari]|uniref:Tetraspanin n=1 Tax=Mesorhabditis belari TaxID=2138241 RepID=A0AAF3EHP8_9BILA
MVVGCGNKCVKYFFWLLNFLFFVLGGLIVGIGLWIIFDPQWQMRLQTLLNIQLQSFNLNNFTVGIWVVIAFGVLLFLVGGLGCGGSCCESLCVIGIYFVLVAILFTLEIAGGVYFYVSKDSLRSWLAQVWKTELVTNYYSNPTIQSQLDQIQRQLNCCGGYGCSDFQSPPSSCTVCFNGNQNQQYNGQAQGCAYLVFDGFTSNLTIVLIVAIAILIVEFIALVFACCTCCAVKSKRNSI